jgi:hypothetical protein
MNDELSSEMIRASRTLLAALTNGIESLQPWLEESLQRDSLVLFNRFERGLPNESCRDLSSKQAIVTITRTDLRKRVDKRTSAAGGGITY